MDYNQLDPVPDTPHGIHGRLIVNFEEESEFEDDIYGINQTELIEQGPTAFLLYIARFMCHRKKWKGSATDLMEQIPEIDMTASVLSRRLHEMKDDLYDVYGILYVALPRTGRKRTFLLISDGGKQEEIQLREIDIQNGEEDMDNVYYEMKDVPIMMTVEEMGKFLRVGICTAYEFIRSGKVPYIKIGRQIRVYRGDILAMRGRAAL